VTYHLPHIADAAPRLRHRRTPSPRRLVLALLCIAGLGACTVDSTREVDSYRKVLSATQPAATQAFRADQPLTLTQALGLTLAGDEQLAIAGETYLQALIAKDRAAAAFLPSIGLAPSYLRQDTTGLATENPLIAAFVPTEATDVPITGTMSVDLVQDWTNVQRAARTGEQRRQLLLDLREAVLLDVAQDYYAVILAERQVVVLTSSLQMQEQRVKDIGAKFNAGTARPLDWSQSQAQASATRVQLVQVQNQVRTGRKVLAFLVGVPRIDGPLEDDLNLPLLADEQSWLTTAMTHRPDLLAAEAEVAAAVKALQSAWGEYFPRVSLNVAYWLSRQSFPDAVKWWGMLQVYVPIFTAGMVHQDVRDAYSRLRQARLSRVRLWRQVDKDLRVALDELSSSQQQVQELGVEVTAAREAARDAENSFSAGTATNLERLTAVDSSLRAELALTTQQIASKVDYLRLRCAAGVLDENPKTPVSFPATAPATTGPAAP
jgi:outer membrane protein TolC